MAMPRAPRWQSKSGFYHVIFRGNGRQLLFEDDEDRSRFLALLEKKTSEYGVAIIAWCLMSNHVHLLLDDGDAMLSQSMHALATAYARYFNGKSGHVGAVFQDRFTSVAISDDGQLLQTVRYIHENPEKAGIARASEYRWSSYGEYRWGARIIKDALVLEMIGGREGFEQFCTDDRFASGYLRTTKRVPDDAAAEVARSVLGDVEPAQLKALPRERRDAGLRELRGAGITIKQIERLTGIGRSTISRATRRSVQ